MFRQIRLFILAILALFISAPVFAASHREAPLIANDPAADITDLYLFRSWQDSDKAIVIMNVIPGQEPGSGPNTVSLIVSWPENTISVLTAGAVAQALDGTSDAD